MSAGTQYSKNLNKDTGNIQTPAFYDSNIDDWIMYTANLIKNASGLWVPVSQTDPMPSNVIGSSSLNHGLVAVTTAGTAVQISSDLACREITITARHSNNGSIYVGGSTVSATSFGVELYAGDSFTFAVKNANLIFIDSSVSGEGISYAAI